VKGDGLGGGGSESEIFLKAVRAFLPDGVRARAYRFELSTPRLYFRILLSILSGPLSRLLHTLANWCF
jgi:hypothetical protein